jgi:hypothetical protein
MRRTENRRGPVWAAPGRFFDCNNNVVVRDGEMREALIHKRAARRYRPTGGGRHVAHIA